MAGLAPTLLVRESIGTPEDDDTYPAEAPKGGAGGGGLSYRR